VPIKNYSDTDKNFPDPIYGSGKDGNYTASSSFSLSRDMYWNNLKVLNGVHIDTNGYKIFVRNNLVFFGSENQSASTSIGLIDGSSNTGTIFGGSITSASNSLGGSSASYSALDIDSIFGSASYFYKPEHAVDGYILNASQQQPLGINGGAGDGVNSGGGVVILSARRVSGNGTIYANGFHDGNFYSTGGGVVIYCSSRIVPSSININVDGYEDGSILQFVV
jgi:hypothetical protein